MEGMTDIERLVALEDIKVLKARRDQAIDTKNWDLYHSLHAEDHISHHADEGYSQWIGPDKMIEGVKASLKGKRSSHHSHTPDITFESPTKANAIWGMEDLIFDEETLELLLHGFGFYHESCEKRDGEWKFTYRQLRRTFVLRYTDGQSPPGVRPATQRS